MTPDTIKAALKRRLQIPTQDLLSSGSTLLNLACSGTPTAAFGKGMYYYFVGDSSSGKTFFSMTLLAEAAQNEHFQNHRLIYNDVERGMLFDVPRFFGNNLAHRLETVQSETVEQFYDHLNASLQKPCVYVLDSMDALRVGAEAKKAQANRRARAKGGEERGSYGTDKAKLNSSHLREALTPLQDTGSILLIISQTRDNIGFGAQFNPKTRSGGNALTFYATLELWTSVRQNLTKMIKGKPRQVGILTRVKVKKNRQIGGVRQVDLPIYWSVGLDDVGGCVDYLVDEDRWPESRGLVKAPDLGLDQGMKREQLIRHIETEGLEKDLRTTVAETWQDIDRACCLKRKPRYE